MTRRLASTIASIALVALGLGIAYTAAPSASAGDSEDVATIRAFMNRPDLAVVEHATPPGPRARTERDYSTMDGQTSFVVDPQSRMVVAAIMPFDKPGVGPDVGRDRALQVAREFATPRVPGFAKLELSDDELLDHGAGGREYSFEWAEQLGTQKAVGPQLVSISVNAASGTVRSLVQVPPVPVTVNTEPTISRDQALAIAAQRFNAPVTTSDSRLSVWWKNNDRTNVQILRWTVTLQGRVSDHADRISPNRAAYVIDAHTREILEVLR